MVQDKATCGYLTVLESHDKHKFKGMDVSGVVGCLCNHVFMWSFADMQVGERYEAFKKRLDECDGVLRFSNVDLAFVAAIEARPFEKDKVPSQTLSYDCQCKYCRHLLERISAAFPELSYLMEDMRFTIPAVHVRNHIDMCMWLFAAQYKEAVGHFHGESVEQIWAEFNLLSGIVRQMSPAARQDYLIAMVTLWNLRKLMGIGG